MDKEIEAVREALASLNRSLVALAKCGVAVEVNAVEASEIGKPVAQTIIQLRLTKTKTEIDVQL